MSTVIRTSPPAELVDHGELFFGVVEAYSHVWIEAPAGVVYFACRAHSEVLLPLHGFTAVCVCGFDARNYHVGQCAICGRVYWAKSVLAPSLKIERSINGKL